jgi:hypothetical protein
MSIDGANAQLYEPSKEIVVPVHPEEDCSNRPYEVARLFRLEKIHPHKANLLAIRLTNLQHRMDKCQLPIKPSTHRYAPRRERLLRKMPVPDAAGQVRPSGKAGNL